MKSIMNLKTDDAIASYMVDNCEFLKDIHPNIISLIGMVCNYFIYVQLNKNPQNKILLLLLFNLRTLCDLLDGAVARKYGKTSKLGHKLDTISDYVNLFVLTHFLFNKYNISKYYNIFAIGIVLMSEIKYDMLDTHEHFKNAEGIDSFYVNNTFLFNNLFYILLVLC